MTSSGLDQFEYERLKIPARTSLSISVCTFAASTWGMTVWPLLHRLRIFLEDNAERVNSGMSPVSAMFRKTVCVLTEQISLNINVICCPEALVEIKRYRP